MSASHNTNPKKVREEARSIATNAKGAGAVWSDLRMWASKNGPVAMKSAVFEFLERYGTQPEAVPIFPEVLRQASQISPTLRGKEREHLVKLADCASLTAKGGPALQTAIDPKADRLLKMPVSGSRPDPKLFFRPAETSKLPQLGNVGPLVPSSDINQLIKARDAMLNVNEKLHELPTPPKTPQKKEHKQSPEMMSFSMPVDSPKSLKTGKKGEELIRSLIDKMKEHAKEEHKTAPSPRMEKAKRAPKKVKVKPKKEKPKKAKAPKKEKVVKKVRPKSRKKAKKVKAPRKVAPKMVKAPKKAKPRPRVISRPKKKRPKPKKKAIKKTKPKLKPKPKKKIVKKRPVRKKAKAKPKLKPKKKPAKKKAKKKVLKKAAKKTLKPKKKSPKKKAKKKPKPRRKKKPAKKKKGKRK